MSRTTKRKAPVKRSMRAWTLASVAAVVVLVGAVVGIVALTRGGSEPPDATVDGAGTATALKPTGGVSSMGLPVLETPGYASGVATFGGVTVQGANWEMGQVPLNVAVLPFWTLTNTGATEVTLGEPRADVRTGCCPGPFDLGSRTLRPGESTVLTFELAMHEGMDGWHDMGVYVPVTSPAEDGWLELGVTGDFRD